MSAKLVKHHNTIGWDWYLETDGFESWVSQPVKEHIEALESENAKLRNEVDNLLDFEHLTSVAVAYAGCDECGEYKQTMLRLFAESAKLRELLQDAWGYISHPANATWTHKKRKEVRDSLADRMRELGVET